MYSKLSTRNFWETFQRIKLKKNAQTSINWLVETFLFSTESRKRQQLWVKNNYLRPFFFLLTVSFNINYFISMIYFLLFLFRQVFQLEMVNWIRIISILRIIGWRQNKRKVFHVRDGKAGINYEKIPWQCTKSNVWSNFLLALNKTLTYKIYSFGQRYLCTSYNL